MQASRILSASTKLISLLLVDLKITERVACYLIQAPPFLELCNCDSLGSSKAIINQDQEYLGYLSYDKNQLIGKGTFKTAHLASLNWVLKSPIVSLGAKNSQSIPVALKQPYDDRNSEVIKHFNYANESCKVLTEGTLLGWADSLLEFAYAFIQFHCWSFSSKGSIFYPTAYIC